MSNAITLNTNKKAFDIFAQVYKLFLLFCTGGAIYYSIEILYRGHSHPSMFILGGLCFVIVGLLNEVIPWDMPIEYQVIIGTLCITILEFISGCILNLWLKLNVWDYSNLPFNILGQVSLYFMLAWIPLTLIAINLDDWIRYRAFREEAPHYHSIIFNKDFKLKKK